MTDQHAPRLVSVPTAADMLGISRATAYRLAGDGQIRTVLIGRRRLVPVAALDEFVARLDTAPARPDARPAHLRSA